MPLIQFDVLVPDHQAERVEEVFREALERLVDKGQLAQASVKRHDTPRLAEGVEEQLRQTYRDEHEDRDLDNAQVRRYALSVEGATESINQLTMVLARLLTPHAALPKDHVLLEDETAHERPAIFPWTVDIQR